MQPVLRKKDFEYICKLIPGDQVLTCSNLDGTRTEPRSYHVSYLSKGCSDGRSLLAILFRRLDDPCVVHLFQKLPSGDFLWKEGREYDNDLSDDEFLAMMMEAK